MRAFIAMCSAVALLSGCGQSDQHAAQSSNSDSTEQPGLNPHPAPTAVPVVADVSAPSPARPNEWASLTSDTFRGRLDALAKANGDDTIKRMTRTKDGFVVTFNDKRYQTGIALLKQLDIANGKFTSKLGLRLSVNSTGTITKIAVIGDRSDPVNLAHFVGTVGSVNNMLNPGQAEKVNLDFLMSLKLMRGDDDESIGQPVASLNSGGAFQCVSFPSGQSTGVGCVATPRS
jgi:hypothetical protein